MVGTVGWRTVKDQQFQTTIKQYSQYVVKCNVARDVRTVGHQKRVLGAVDRGLVPERQQRLLVVVRRNGRFRKPRMEQLPQGAKMWSELKNKFFS